MNNNKRIKSRESQTSARDIASIIFRHKFLMGVTFLIIAVGAVAFALLTPNEYESRMKILVKNTRSDVPITPERTATAGSSGENEVSEVQINSEIELLTSDDLLRQVVTECNLYGTRPSFLSRLGFKDAPVPVAAQIESATRRLQKDLVITPVKKANIIEVKYSSQSSETAARVLRKIQDLYLEKHLKLHRPPGTYEFFKAQADEYEGQLQAAEKTLSDFQQSMNVVSPIQQKEQTVHKLTEAKAKLLETQAFLREVNDRITRAEQQLRTLQPRVVTQSRALPNQYSAERLNTLVVELQNRRTQLLTKFRPEDRLVREVDQQLKTTKAALDKAANETTTEQSTDLNPLRQTLEAELARGRVDQAGAEGRHQALIGQVAQYEALLSRLEGSTAQFEDLNRKVKQSEESYQVYQRKEEEARITNELDLSKITNVSIAESPVESQLPARPNRPLNIGLGLVLGLLLSAGSVVIAELARDTVLTASELEMLTGQSVLASIPRGGRVRSVELAEPESVSTEGSAPKAIPPRLSSPKIHVEPPFEWLPD